jgi:hypothetical protein
VYLDGLLAAKGPVLVFSTYNLNKGGKTTLRIPLDVEEMDGSWNWVYAAYSNKE